MRETIGFQSIIVTLLVVLSTVGIGAVALTGTAAAQSGTVQITDELQSDADSFEVEITSLQDTSSACLEVANLATDAVFLRTDVTAGDRFDVSADELGGLETGDVVEATLYDEPSDCATALSTDSRTVQGTAQFDVTLDATNSPVVEGDALTVNATIENTGDAGGTQTIDLLIGDSVEDSRTLTLDQNGSQQVSLQWQTDPGDAGTYQTSVASEDAFDGTNVIVEEPEPPSFDVTIDSTNSPISEGERLNVTAQIENSGDVSDTQTLELRIGDIIQDARSVSLAGGTSTNLTFDWETELGDAGAYNATVSSENDTALTDVSVRERDPANFAVDINTTNGPVLEGEMFRVTATVYNTGSLADTQSVDLGIDGTVVDSRMVTLEQGDSETITLEWNTTLGDAGLHSAEVASANDSDWSNATVLAEGALHLSINSTNSPVVEGDELQVTATVLNTGDTETSQSVTLNIGEETVDTTNISLPGGASESVTLTWQTEAGDRGEYDAQVATDDDSDSVAVSVVTDAWFDVSIRSTNDPISPREELFVTARVTNTGGVSGAQTVTLVGDGAERDSQNLTLEPNESQEITLSWVTENADPGDYEIEIASQDNRDLGVVTVSGGDNTTLWLLVFFVLILIVLLAIAYYLYTEAQNEENGRSSLAPGSR